MAARSAGGSTRASEPEGSAYTLTFRADDGVGVPSGLGETEVEVVPASSTTASCTSRTTASMMRRRQLLSAPRTWDAPKFRLASVLVTSTAGGTTAGGAGAARPQRRPSRPGGAPSHRVHVVQRARRHLHLEPRRRRRRARVARTASRLSARRPRTSATRWAWKRRSRPAMGVCSPAPRRGGRGERREVQRAERPPRARARKNRP